MDWTTFLLGVGVGELATVAVFIASQWLGERLAR